MNARHVVALCLCASVPARAEQSPAPVTADTVVIERLQWSRSVDGPDPITSFEVRNDFGDIRARAAGDRVLDVSMVVQRLDPAGEKVGFTVERRGSAVALVVAYPPGRVRDAIARPPKDSYDRLDLVVFVPPGVTLRAHTLRGQVEVRGLKNDVEAATADGPILLRTAGAMQARTVSGEITAVPEAAALATRGAPLILQSDTGTIDVTLPAGRGPEIRVETAGVIESALRLRHTRHGDRTRAVSPPDPRAVRLLLVDSRSGRVRIVRDGP